jgi:hypothetical protein
VRILILYLAFSGCGAVERVVTGITGSLTYKCSKHGVEYIQSDSGIAVSYDGEGKE